MTIKNTKMTSKTSLVLFTVIPAILMLSIGTTLPEADAVSVPDTRVDWESHDDVSNGAKTVIAKKDPSLTNPATDYWWAKTFTSWGVYSVWIDEGAGTVKYNPIGGGATKYVGFVYNWDEDANSQAYSFGAATISGNAYPMTQNTSGSTWDRSSTDISSSITITGLVVGHSKFAVQQSNVANALDGSFTLNKWYNGAAWADLSTATNLNYCENDNGVTGKDIDKVGGSVNSLTFGTSALADDCTTSVFESDYLPG